MKRETEWTKANIKYFRGKQKKVEQKIDYVWWGLFGLYVFMVVAFILEYMKGGM